MRVLLLDREAGLCEAWRSEFAGVDGVSVYHGRFESVSGAFDCLVSPANSFGLMDGGMDAAIIEFFGVALEERVQREIWRRCRGEQPVGTCLMAQTEDARCPWLAHCPTMRVPMDVSWTNHAYAALLAALTSAEAAGVQVLACPGRGRARGRCRRRLRRGRCGLRSTAGAAATLRHDGRVCRNGSGGRMGGRRARCCGIGWGGIREDGGGRAQQQIPFGKDKRGVSGTAGWGRDSLEG